MKKSNRIRASLQIELANNGNASPLDSQPDFHPAAAADAAHPAEA